MITEVIKLGAKGDGSVIIDDREYFVPYVIDGEQVEVTTFPDSNHAHLEKIIKPSNRRRQPICPLFGICGACKLQHISDYKEYKTNVLLKTISSAVSSDVVINPINFITGSVRRRALLKAENGILGFFKERSNDIVKITRCPLLTDEINTFIKNIKLPEITATINITQITNGIDVDINTKSEISPSQNKSITNVFKKAIRLTVNGSTVFEKEKPIITFGNTKIRFPAGSFLQPSKEGENALLTAVKNMIIDGSVIADIFCGIGTFTFPLSDTAQKITGFEAVKNSVYAINTSKKKNVIAYERDLFLSPLSGRELDEYTAVVMDPPRDGALHQSQMFSKTKKLPQIIYISCNPATFTRDAKIITASGFKLKTITPVDQFEYTPHTEIVADFQRE